MTLPSRTPFANAPVVARHLASGTPSCAWFIGHWERPASGHQWHPTLGWVPVCPSCVDFTNDTKDGCK